MSNNAPNTLEKKTPRKSSLSSFGVSISALSKANQPDQIEDNRTVQVSITESFTPLELLNEWKAYAESIIEEHHLRNTMIHCLPDLQSRDIFEVVVNNPVQEQKLTEHSLSILTVLREKLKNTNIQMKIRVSIDNEKKLGFTSLEKFNLMIEENEALRRLKDEFGLELQ